MLFTDGVVGYNEAVVYGGSEGSPYLRIPGPLSCPSGMLHYVISIFGTGRGYAVCIRLFVRRWAFISRGGFSVRSGHDAKDS